MPSTALRLLQQLVKKSESNLSPEDEDRGRARRCWNVEARIHCARALAARNIRQAHMNPASSQKPASIKDFCDIEILHPSPRHASRAQIFASRSARAMLDERDSTSKNFFSQAVPGSACEADSSLKTNESPNP